MPQYVDGFVLPVPKKHLAAYRRIARNASRVWRDHGALAYHECVGEDLAIPGVLPFTRAVKTKPGETVIFAWIIYRSRAHRDRVNAKAMQDPRLAKYLDPKNVPFDVKRMFYGGFQELVRA